MILNRWHSLLSPLLNWYFDRIVDKTVDRVDRTNK